MNIFRQPRPPIPEAIKRQIRQRCGFGCVICGVPLYEYDHVHGFQGSHNPADITLLCDRHHREKTSQLLPLQAVLKGNADPFNLRTGASKPYPFHYSGSRCLLTIGSNIMGHQFADGGGVLAGIVIDNEVLLGFEHQDDHLMLSMTLRDEFNEVVMSVLRNELRFRTDAWDIEFVARTLVVREAARKILVEMVFSPPGELVLRRGRFLSNGVEVLVDPSMLTVNDMKIEVTGMIAMGGAVLLGVGDNAGYNAHLFVDKVNRYARLGSRRHDHPAASRSNEKDRPDS